MRITSGTICGRDHHSRAQFDQEPEGQGAPGDAPDADKQAWYFGMKAHVEADSKTKAGAFGGGDGGQRARLDGAARPVARREMRVTKDQGCRGQSEVTHECSPCVNDCYP